MKSSLEIIVRKKGNFVQSFQRPIIIEVVPSRLLEQHQQQRLACIPHVQLFGSGPTDMREEVAIALQTPILDPLNPHFIEVQNIVKMEGRAYKLNELKI